MRDNERDALVRVSGDLQEYANGCNAIYLKELAARIEALAAPAEGGEVVIVDCPACMGRGYQGTGIDEAPTTTCRACDGTGAVDEDGLIDSAGGAKDDFCTTEGHVTGGTDSCINCGTTAVAAVVPDAPLKVFDSGPWIYEPDGVRFSGQQLDGAAFAEYRRLLAAAPAAPKGGVVDEARVERECRYNWPSWDSYSEWTREQMRKATRAALATGEQP